MNYYSVTDIIKIDFMKQKNVANIKILLGNAVIVHLEPRYKNVTIWPIYYNFGAYIREFQHEN